MNTRRRRLIACEAARLLADRRETDFHAARIAAARRVAGGAYVPEAELPHVAEISAELQHLSGVAPNPGGDRFDRFRSLLAPLESVRQPPARHPEGDALYHSLQVFDLAREELPYDEEFLLAALLHDVGKALDPRDHVTAGLAALGDDITERTRWLIEHHSEGHLVLQGTIGHRALRRLKESESYEELLLLARCDRDGREPGVAVPELEEALGYLQELAAEGE